MKLPLLLGIFLLTLASGVAGQNTSAGKTEIQDALDQAVQDARAKYQAPAITVAVWKEGKMLAATTQGVRANGFPEAATNEDLWHIGSCGKGMTAAMILRLVDKGQLRLGDPLSKLLPPELVRQTRPSLLTATLEQLLNHTSGMAEIDLDNRKASRIDVSLFASVSDPDIRYYMQGALLGLKAKPVAKPGEKFSYSNWNYLTAAVIASQATGKSWWQLMQEEVFIPLQMQNVGIGPPGKEENQPSQPWGHDKSHGKDKSLLLVKIPAEPASELPLYIAPAGLIHLSMQDWGRFSNMLLKGQNNQSDYLKPETFSRWFSVPVLKEPYPYGLGVGVLKSADGVTRVLTHTGSNGYWRADYRIFTSTGRVYLMAANIGTEEMDMAFNDIKLALNKAFDQKQ